jgi:hypothetical protein
MDPIPTSHHPSRVDIIQETHSGLIHTSYGNVMLQHRTLIYSQSTGDSRHQ